VLKPGVCCLHTAKKVGPAGMLRWGASTMMLLEKQGGVNDPGPPIPHTQAKL